MLSKRYLLAALVMLGMMACSNEEDCGCEYDNPVEVKITGDMLGMKSRVIGNQWTYDQIGVRVTNAPNSNMEELYKNVGYETESNTTTALFTPIKQKDAIFFKNNTEVVTFAAYAPYKQSQPNVLPENNGKFSVDTRSHNNNESQQISINYLYASGATASKMDPILAFTQVSPTEDYSFKHVMSRLILTFKASISDGFTGNEIFNDGYSSYVLGGLKLVGNFDMTTGVAQTTGALVNDWDITNCIHVDDKVNMLRTYTLLLLPQENGPNSKMTITIKVNGTTYTNTQTINANLKAGMSYHYTIILKKNGLEVSGSTITDWIEAGDVEGGAMSE